jgi:hypothetical protein
MGIQGQVVGQQIDIVRQQGGQAFFHPTGDAATLVAPKQTMVDQQGMGLGVNGIVNEGQTCAHTTHQATNLQRPFDLQSIGTIVLEPLGRQKPIDVGDQGLTLDH